MTVGPGVGDLVFPYSTLPPRWHQWSEWKLTPDSEKEDFQVFVVGCINYRDQFEQPAYSAFIYWLVDPKAGVPMIIRPRPDIKVEGEWRVNNTSIWNPPTTKKKQ
jgi:hypothetical protein